MRVSEGAISLEKVPRGGGCFKDHASTSRKKARRKLQAAECLRARFSFSTCMCRVSFFLLDVLLSRVRCWLALQPNCTQLVTKVALNATHFITSCFGLGKFLPDMFLNYKALLHCGLVAYKRV